VKLGGGGRGEFRSHWGELDHQIHKYGLHWKKKKSGTGIKAEKGKNNPIFPTNLQRLPLAEKKEHFEFGQKEEPRKKKQGKKKKTAAR